MISHFLVTMSFPFLSPCLFLKHASLYNFPPLCLIPIFLFQIIFCAIMSNIVNHPLHSSADAGRISTDDEKRDSLRSRLRNYLSTRGATPTIPEPSKLMKRMEIKLESGLIRGQAKQIVYVPAENATSKMVETVTLTDNGTQLHTDTTASDVAECALYNNDPSGSASDVELQLDVEGLEGQRSLDEVDARVDQPNRSLDDEDDDIDMPPAALQVLIERGELIMPDDESYVITKNKPSNQPVSRTKPAPSSYCRKEAHAAQRPKLITAPPYSKIYLGSSGYEPSQLCNKIVSGTSPTTVSFTGDPRSCATIVRGNCKEDATMAIGLLPGTQNPYTVSAVCERSRIKCFCLTQSTAARERHSIGSLLDDSPPVLLILGDAHTPPALGGDGRCAIILRLHHPTPDNMLAAVKAFFSNGSRLPQDSAILLSLNSFLIETNSALYLKEMEKLINELGQFFLRIWSGSKRVTPDMYSQWSHYFRARFLIIIPPHQLVDTEKAADFAAVSHASEAAAALAEMHDAGPIASHYFNFMQSLGQAATPCDEAVSVPSFSLDIFPPGACASASCYTEKCVRPAYRGLELLTPGLIYIFWCEVALKLFGWYDQQNLCTTNLPHIGNLWAGIAGEPVRNLKLTAAMPEAFDAIRQLANTCNVLIDESNNLGPDSSHSHNMDVSVNQLSDCNKPVNASFALLGNSNANNIRLDLIKKGANARHYGFPSKHITNSAVEAINRYNFSSDTLVVLDGFCNATLEPEVREDDSFQDRLPLHKKEKSFVPRITTSRDRGKIFHQVVDLHDGNYRSLVPISDSDVDGVVELLQTMAEQIADKAGAKVLVLGPLPRFPTRCCQDHNPDGGSVNKFIRDLNYYLSLHKAFNNDKIRFLPFHIAVKSTVKEPYAGAGVVAKDNVHLLPEIRHAISAVLLDIKGCDWARLGYPDRSYHDIRFEPWRNALHKHNVEAALHATDCPDLPLIGSKRARDSSATAGLHNPRRSRIEQPDQHRLQPPRDGVHGRLGPPIHHRYRGSCKHGRGRGHGPGCHQRRHGGHVKNDSRNHPYHNFHYGHY